MDEQGTAPGAHDRTEAERRAARQEDPGSAETGAAAPAPSRSRLRDIADQTVVTTGRSGTAAAAVEALTDRTPAQPPAAAAAPGGDAAQVKARQRQFLHELGEFRRSRVLVPVDALPDGSGGEAPLTVDAGGVRWILAFTGEAALARYAVARGEAERKRRYWRVWGAALLDAAVPTVAGSGMPCGLLVDVADGEHGRVLPPVLGVVPQDVAVDGPVPALTPSDGTEKGE
ncbi:MULTISPECIES: SseB family protein [Streptomyces]|uniref:SseB family protein n=1 Tax=Streptomyces TaxID=1883 RepID=UPI0031EE1B80